ncbi:MAG: hypothetical protein SFY92_11215 [Verrucomicrobiae bacterium]|nr:hypothetical protein [Verrucomicrobiae bacterium]
MKGFIILLILAAIGAGIYVFMLKPDPAFEQYKIFANHVVNKRFKEAKEMTEGQALLAVEEQEEMNKNMGKAGFSMDVLGATYTLDSKENAGSETNLKISQTVRVNPPGQTSAFGTAVPHKQEATLVQKGEKWVVTKFKDEIEK